MTDRVEAHGCGAHRSGGIARRKRHRLGVAQGPLALVPPPADSPDTAGPTEEMET